jgi:hypothetical protein
MVPPYGGGQPVRPKTFISVGLPDWGNPFRQAVQSKCHFVYNKLNMRKLAILLGVLFLVGAGCIPGEKPNQVVVQSPEDLFDKQERCLLATNKLVEKENEGTTSSFDKNVFSAKNHYNIKLNKCFAVLNTDYGWALYDVLENRDIASFHVLVSPSTGKTESVCFAPPDGLLSENDLCDYNTYVKPYMTE